MDRRAETISLKGKDYKVEALPGVLQGKHSSAHNILGGFPDSNGLRVPAILKIIFSLEPTADTKAKKEIEYLKKVRVLSLERSEINYSTGRTTFIREGREIRLSLQGVLHCCTERTVRMGG